MFVVLSWYHWFCLIESELWLIFSHVRWRWIINSDNKKLRHNYKSRWLAFWVFWSNFASLRRLLVNSLSVFIYWGRDRICGFVYNKTFIIYRRRHKAKQKVYECRLVVSVHMDAVTAQIWSHTRPVCVCFDGIATWLNMSMKIQKIMKSTWAWSKQLIAFINTESERIWRVDGEKRPLNWNKRLGERKHDTSVINENPIADKFIFH